MSDRKDRDNSMDFLYVGGMLLIVLFGMMYFLREKIVSFYRHLYYYYASALDLFLPSSWFLPVKDKVTVYESNELGYGDIYSMSYVQYPVIALLICGLGYLFYQAYKNNKVEFFRRNFNDKKRFDLVKSELQHWGWTAPVIGKDIHKQPVDEGEWAMPLTPLEFCKKYVLLTPDNRVDQIKANYIFLHQLGPIWKGFEYLKPEEKGLLACFAAQCSKIEGGIEDSRKYLRVMALTSTTQPDFSWAESVWNKYKESPHVKKIVYSYGYNYTVLSTMLLNARLYGKLANSFFLWLKPYNRELYFVLRSAGSPTITTGPQVPFAEGAAAFAHRLAEESYGRPIIRPMIKEATAGLVDYIENTMDLSSDNDEYKIDNIFLSLEDKGDFKL